MKKKYTSIIFIALLCLPLFRINSQTFQAGIFNSSGNTLTIKLTPSITANGQITYLQFSIIWEHSYGVSLGAPSGSFGLASYGSGTVNLGGTDYDYVIYASTPGNTISWTGGSENTVMSVDVNQTGIGTGTFSLAANGDVPSGDFGIELTGSDVTNTSSPFYQASVGNVPLPVELSSFSASVNQNNVNLIWKTATEVNNNGFEVQRGIRDQKSEISKWENVGFVQGHGNSNSPKEYSFTDKNLTGGTNFLYRLKQIDNDGKYQYSKEVEVKVVPLSYELSQNYPNPFNPTTEIKYNLPEASRVTLNVYNIIGQQVASLVNREVEAGFHSVTFDGRDLPSGTYIYRIQTPNYTRTKKMVLLK